MNRLNVLGGVTLAGAGIAAYAALDANRAAGFYFARRAEQQQRALTELDASGPEHQALMNTSNFYGAAKTDTIRYGVMTAALLAGSIYLITRR